MKKLRSGLNVSEKGKKMVPELPRGRGLSGIIVYCMARALGEHPESGHQTRGLQLRSGILEIR
jgi:hypothetical protein